MLTQAVTRAKMMTQIFNNYKVKKIVAIRQRRETILKTVEVLKKKLVNWRIFT